MRQDTASAERLRSSGLRRTPVRVGVLEAIERSSRPVDASDLSGQLPPGTDLVTIYRTLKTLTQKGLIHRVRDEDRAWRYAAGAAPREGAHRHAHFVCDRCGAMRCVDEVRLPARSLTGADVGRGSRVTYAEITLHGLCARCNG